MEHHPLADTPDWIQNGRRGKRVGEHQSASLHFLPAGAWRQPPPAPIVTTFPVLVNCIPWTHEPKHTYPFLGCFMPGIHSVTSVWLRHGSRTRPHRSVFSQHSQQPAGPGEDFKGWKAGPQMPDPLSSNVAILDAEGCRSKVFQASLDTPCSFSLIQDEKIPPGSAVFAPETFPLLSHTAQRTCLPLLVDLMCHSEFLV